MKKTNLIFSEYYVEHLILKMAKAMVIILIFVSA